jgi:ABC-2 type transport system permease protein
MIRETLAQLNTFTNMLSDDLKSLGDMLGGVDRWMGRSLTNTNSTARSAGGGGITMPFSIAEEKVARESKMPAYNGYAHSFGGMGVQFILMAAIDMGVGILLERQRGLWKRLRSAPLSRFVLLGSKAVSTTLISIFTLAFSFAFAWLVFDVKVEGSFLGFVLCIIAFSLFTASVGLLLASLGMTPGGTRGLAIPVVLIMVMLGGAWVPAFVFPQWLQQVTLIMPTRWAIDALDAMTWRGLGLEAAWAPVGVLLGYTVVFGWLAVKRFKWEAE